MSNLFIGSVFAKCDRNQYWLDLQLKFIRRYTKDFDYGVFLNRIDQSLFSDLHVIGSEDWENFEESQRHAFGLNKLVEYAIDKYEYCLLLDSDAFPIGYWFESLLESMKGFSAAAPLRYENLDSFGHPSAFFFKCSEVRPTFGLFEGVNLLGETVKDTRSDLEDFFPLLRTNKRNPHPLFYAVYWDLFYHHGAGTRSDPTKYRAANQGYYKSTNRIDEKAIFRKLVNHPESYLNSLIDSGFKGYL